MRTAIVEDERADAEHLRSCLNTWARERGVVLVPPPELFPSGDALLESFVPDKYDLIFLDVLMDGTNGMETARRIRETDSRCRLVFITSSPDFAVESYRVSAAYYLLKPYSFEQLRDALDRCEAQALELDQFIDLPGRQRLYLHRTAYTEYEGRHICVHGGDGSVSYVPMSQGELSARLLTYKEVKSEDISKIPSIPETAFCFNYSSKAYGDLDPNPLGSARTMNSWLYGDASKYFKNGGWRTGITMTDYCDEVLCDLIIASNYGRVGGAHTCTYMDISVDDWFHDFVEKAAELGLMKGTGNKQFSPKSSLESSMAVQILYNREGRPAVEIEDGFSPDLWYAPAVSWGIQQGIIEADGFEAEKPMPRQDMVQMMYNYAKLKGYDISATADLSDFADADKVSPETKDAMSWAVGSGIISGDDQKQLLPEDGILRSEAAKVFVKFATIYNK